MGVAVGIIIGVVVLGAVAYFLYRAAGSSPSASAVVSSAEEAPADTGAAPVAEFHVRGEEAQVYFDVPLPAEPDEVLFSLLKHEAIEVVREKRHSLPIDQVTKVVAFAKAGSEYQQVGSVDLETPGALPPPAPPPVVFKHVGPDPLSSFAGGPASSSPETVSAIPEEGLKPAGADVQMPAQISASLRLQGIDPETAAAGELVLGILSLTGFTVTPGDQEDTYTATSATGRTFVFVDPLSETDYPELSEGVLNKFMAQFSGSGLDRGLLISDKFGPYLVYEKERREPRIQCITRERLQHFVDSIALA